MVGDPVDERVGSTPERLELHAGVRFAHGASIG
jgi:hypothetical protein